MIRNPDLCKAKMEEVQDQELQNLSFSQSNLTSDTQVFNEETKSINTLKSVQSVEKRYEENESLERPKKKMRYAIYIQYSTFNFALLCIEK